MGPPDMSGLCRALEIGRVAATAASQTDLLISSIDTAAAGVSMPSGTGLVAISYAISAGSVTGIKIQSADDSGFSTNLTTHNLKAIGTDTDSAFTATGAASGFQTRAVRIDGMRRYVRSVYTSAASTAGPICVILVAGGYHNLLSTGVV